MKRVIIKWVYGLAAKTFLSICHLALDIMFIVPFVLSVFLHIGCKHIMKYNRIWESKKQYMKCMYVFIVQSYVYLTREAVKIIYSFYAGQSINHSIKATCCLTKNSFCFTFLLLFPIFHCGSCNFSTSFQLLAFISFSWTLLYCLHRIVFEEEEREEKFSYRKQKSNYEFFNLKVYVHKVQFNESICLQLKAFNYKNFHFTIQWYDSLFFVLSDMLY